MSILQLLLPLHIPVFLTVFDVVLGAEIGTQMGDFCVLRGRFDDVNNCLLVYFCGDLLVWTIATIIIICNKYNWSITDLFDHLLTKSIVST